MGEGREV